jgi:hypothetical protein
MFDHMIIPRQTVWVYYITMTSTKNKLLEKLGCSKSNIPSIMWASMNKSGIIGAKSAGEISLFPQQAYI